jgi:hypothetical protein
MRWWHHFSIWFGKPCTCRATEPHWCIPMPVDWSWSCNTPFSNVMASVQFHVCIIFYCKLGENAALVFHIQKQNEKVLNVRDVRQWARQLKMWTKWRNLSSKTAVNLLAFWEFYLGHLRKFWETIWKCLDCHKICAPPVVWRAEGDCFGPRHHGLLLLVLQVGYSSLLTSDFKAFENYIVENPNITLYILKSAVVCVCCQFCESHHVVMWLLRYCTLFVQYRMQQYTVECIIQPVSYTVVVNNRNCIWCLILLFNHEFSV